MGNLPTLVGPTSTVPPPKAPLAPLPRLGSRAPAHLEVKVMGEVFSREEGVFIYRASTLLRQLTGWGRRRIARKILELYGDELTVDEKKLEKLIDTYIWRKCKPKFVASSFERSLYFHKARKLCIEIKREHPSWGYRRITTELNRRLPVRIGRSTVWGFLHSTEEREIPLHADTPADWGKIAYLAGAALGDLELGNEYLSVADPEFAAHFANTLSQLTRREAKPIYDPQKRLYRVHAGAWLKDLIRLKLWKILADTHPTPFLKGFYDAEGWCTPLVCRNKITSITIGANGRNKEIIYFVEKLTRRLGFKTHIYESKNQGKPLYTIIIWGFYQAKVFEEKIGFRVSYRRIYLRFLLSLENLSQQERYKKWKQWIKQNKK